MQLNTTWYKVSTELVHTYTVTIAMKWLKSKVKPMYCLIQNIHLKWPLIPLSHTDITHNQVCSCGSGNNCDETASFMKTLLCHVSHAMKDFLPEWGWGWTMAMAGQLAIMLYILYVFGLFVLLQGYLIVHLNVCTISNRMSASSLLFCTYCEVYC